MWGTYKLLQGKAKPVNFYSKNKKTKQNKTKKALRGTENENSKIC